MPAACSAVNPIGFNRSPIPAAVPTSSDFVRPSAFALPSAHDCTDASDPSNTVFDFWPSASSWAPCSRIIGPYLIAAAPTRPTPAAPTVAIVFRPPVILPSAPPNRDPDDSASPASLSESSARRPNFSCTSDTSATYRTRSTNSSATSRHLPHASRSAACKSISADTAFMCRRARCPSWRASARNARNDAINTICSSGTHTGTSAGNRPSSQQTA